MSEKMAKEKGSEHIAMRKFDYFRRFLAQFSATTAENMLLFGMGLSGTFPVIIIPALTGILNDHNQNETLSLTASEASWLGSIGFIFGPIGSVLSAIITDYLGRKKAMMVVNIPLIIAWFLLCNATEVWQIFIANILFGLASGLTESPTITYIGEICEPAFRGILIAYTHAGWTLGMLVVSILNTLLPWRTVALVCMFVPVLTTLALCFVPETPLWLMSKSRTAEAEKSLQWLRGWVSKADVRDELRALQRYSERYKYCAACIKQNKTCEHPPPTMMEKLSELKRQQTLRPLFIVLSLFFIASFSGPLAMGPFMVQVFKAYDSPIAPDKAVAALSVVDILATISFLCLIRFTGKRYLYLTMLTLVFLCSAIMGAYGFSFLPGGYNSFDKTENFELQNPQLSYIPFICIIVMSFCSFCGVATMPWQMISEVFPYKTRGTATGLTAAINYFLIFVATKTYYNLETTLSMPGFSLLNCFIIAIGIIVMFNILPETENRSLEDIEIHFSDKSKKITNFKIEKLDLHHKYNNEMKSNSNVTVASNQLGTPPAVIINQKDDPTTKSTTNIKQIGCDNRGFVNDNNN